MGIEDAADTHAKMVLEECLVESGKASSTEDAVEKDGHREETAMA